MDLKVKHKTIKLLEKNKENFSGPSAKRGALRQQKRHNPEEANLINQILSKLKT